jgi:hypothetical protein
VHIKVGLWVVRRIGAINKITKAIKIKKINNTSCHCLAPSSFLFQRVKYWPSRKKKVCLKLQKHSPNNTPDSGAQKKQKFCPTYAFIQRKNFAL